MSRHGGPATIYRHGSNNFRPKNVDNTPQLIEEATPSLSSRRKVKKAVSRVPEYRLPASSSIEHLSTHASSQVATRNPARIPVMPAASSGARQPLGATKPAHSAERLQKQKSTYTITSAKVTKAAARVNPVKVSIASLREAAYSSILEATKSSMIQYPSPIPLEHPRGSMSMQALAHSDSSARFEAFLTRTGRTDSVTKGNPHEVYASRRRSQSLSRLQTRPAVDPPAAEAKKDSLDSDFLVQFIKDHQLAPELAAAVQKELNGGMSPPCGTEDPPTARAQASQAAPSTRTSTNPHQDYPIASKSPLLSPAGKPPRPPRSERRVSHSPVIPSAAPQLDNPVTTTSAVYEDAHEIPHLTSQNNHAAPAPCATRQPSLSQSSRSQGRRDSRGRRDTENAGGNSGNIRPQNRTPPTSHFARAFGSPHSEEIAQAIAVVEQGQEQEDYERDRRLSSLLRGLGIQGLGEQSLDARKPRNRKSSKVAEEITSEAPEEEDWAAQAAQSFNDNAATIAPSRLSTDAHVHRPPTLPRRSSRRSSNNLKRKGSQRSSMGAYAEGRRDSQRTSLGLSDSVLATILPSLDSAYRASLPADQRNSMSISDSVLASILASESFCLPPGARLSMEQIAARLSIEVTNALKRHSQGQSQSQHRDIARRRSRSEHSLHPTPQENTLPKPTVEEHMLAKHVDTQEWEEQWDAQQAHVLPSPEQQQCEASPYEDSWQPDSNDVILHEDEVEISNVGEFTFGSIYPEESFYEAPEPQIDHAYQETGSLSGEQEDRNPFYQSIPAGFQCPEEALPAPSSPEPEATVVSLHEEPQSYTPPQIHQTQTSASLEPDATTSLRRKRTLSTNYLHKLSSSFSSSSSNKTSRPRRNRLPSIFGGLSGKTPSSVSDQETTALRAASPVPSIASPRPIQPQVAVKRKRALTGPARLIDIAKAVTNSPSFSQLASQGQESEVLTQLPVCNNTWRSNIPEGMLQELIRVHPPQELQRQEVIWELCQTEESFVNGLKGVIKVFSSPLRDHQGRWISGIPIMVTRLFGWLDDIVHFHSQLQAVLTRTRSAQGLLTIRIAEAFLPMIPRLAIHQAYLSRFEQVTRAIEDMILAPESEFGEFVRMQQALPECGSMTLSSFLLKPVQRLMKYPLFFKQLCQLTPPEHPDYEATSLLFQLTDGLIRAMQEVKAREEDYEHICSLVRKIHGLPTGMELGKRDRRLLASGPLKQIHLNERDVHALTRDESHGSAYSASPGADSGVFISPRPGSTYSEVSSSGTSTLSEGRGYALSPASVSSGSTRPNSINSSLRPESMLSYTSASTINSFATASSSSTLHPQSSHRGALPGSYFTSPASTTHSSHPGKHRILKARAKETAIQIFVFSDLVVFATRQTEGFRIKSNRKQNVKGHEREEKTSKYRVVSDWGVAKIIGITDLTGRTDHDNLLQLDLLPIWSDKEVTQSSLWNAAMATSILISIPVATLSTQSAKDKELEYYLHALDQSYASSLKSLSFSDESTTSSQRLSSIGKNGDAHYAMPRSPSERDSSRHRAEDYVASQAREAEDEREERQWWSARLRKVQREMEDSCPDSPQDGLADDRAQQIRAEQFRQAEERKHMIMMEASERLERKMSSNSLRVGLAISYDEEEKQEQWPRTQASQTLHMARTTNGSASNSRLAVSAVKRPR